MGSSASKATKAASKIPAAATNTARKYPTRTPTTSMNTTTRAVPEEQLKPTASSEATDSGLSDGGTTTTTSSSTDTDFTSPQNHALNARLQALGPVQPNPTYSNTSTFNAHNTSTSSFADPSLSATQFTPSRSNPLQTIFPSSHTNVTSNMNSNSSSVGNEGLSGGSRSSNPAVSLLTARYRLASEAENEFAQTGKSAAREGRQFLDVTTLRQILVLRDEKGVKAEEIERVLGLKRGVVERLGRKGVVGVGS